MKTTVILRPHQGIVMLFLAAFIPPSLAAPASAPGTLLWNGDALARHKAAWRASPDDGAPGAPRAALPALLDEAGAALAQPPLSVVTGKRRPAASGDPHDYFSVSYYSWPNPNTPDGLPYVYRDGEINHDGAHDRATLGKLLKTLRPLALAWHFTDDPRHAAHAARLLRAWFLDPATRMNPHMRYAQAIPGSNDGRPPGMIDAVVLLEIVDCIQLLKNSPQPTPADHAALKTWFSEFLTWCLESDFGHAEAAKGNNHGTWYYAQTGLYAAFAGREDEIRPLYETRLLPLIRSQIEADGRQPLELRRTRSMHYSAYNLTAWAHIATLARRMGLDYWNPSHPIGERLHAALSYLARHSDPAVKWPHPEIQPQPERNQLRALFLRANAAAPASLYDSALAVLPDDPPEQNYIRFVYGFPAPSPVCRQASANPR
ncbi:MAG: alginate lyase family protein [Opitutaceae bacterium]|jgi:hypothetical protein|nr:alginate lyase family protein [Opitutaceae bacterium]